MSWSLLPQKMEYCSNCNIVCRDISEEICSKPETPLYVCNDCIDAYHCTLRKYFYIFNTVASEYHSTLVKVRKGINLSKGECILLNLQIQDGIQKEQSVHHIMATQKNFFTICEKTVYRYVNAGVIRTKRGDLPRPCMMRPRKK